MDYKSALALKKNISEDVLWPLQRKMARVFSAGSSVVRSIRLSRELRSNINGVGIVSTPQTGFQLQLLTRGPLLSTPAVAAYYNLSPDQLRIRRAGSIRLLAYTTRLRPPFPGVSVGHPQVSAGSLGCFVKKAGDNSQYFLSNNHILANLNECSLGDPVFQPGPVDGGAAVDVIARLADFEPLQFDGPNYFDAAIARMEQASADTGIPLLGTLTGTRPPAVDTRVLKTGRSSGLTAGVIVSSSTDIEVDYGKNRKLVFRDQFEIEGRNQDNAPVPFSTSGDSGAVIVEADQNAAIGLLFAGDDAGNSFASAIDPVLSRFSVFLV